MAQLAIRQEGWEPEFELSDNIRPQIDIAESDLKRISEQYEISLENLESLIEDLSNSDQN